MSDDATSTVPARTQPLPLVAWVLGGAFGLLVVLPLYVLTVSVVVRSGLLDLDGPPFGDEQFKALLAFLGVALGTVATVLGTLITKASTDRAFAQEQQLELTRVREQGEAEARLKLDTAVQALELIKHDDGLADKPVIAGSLGTLVHLGHPDLAMRVLEVAVKHRAIDVSTCIWLVDHVLRGGESSAYAHMSAATLLRELVPEVTLELEPGAVDWPECLWGSWPSGVGQAGTVSLLHVMLALLTSREHAWWLDDSDFSWIVVSFDEVVRTSAEGSYERGLAADVVLRLLPALTPGADLIGLADARTPADVKARADAAYVGQHPLPDLEQWLQRAAGQPPAP